MSGLEQGENLHAGPTATSRFGKYVVLEKLGQGGMAEVHRAVVTGPLGFRKTVALKRILPEFSAVADFRERFIEEARVAAELNHSNVVQIFEFGERSGSYYLSMELVDGMDVEQILALSRQVGLLAQVRLCAPFLVAQAARGLAYAHQATRRGRPLGLVHRDVSPPNLLVSRAGEVKVTDFGIVRIELANRMTASGAIMGKLRYMSPEQALGHELDRRSDVFALGLVLHELLTGEPALGGTDLEAVLSQLKAGHLVPPSQHCPAVGPDLDAIVARALAFHPAQRYSTADDLAADLERHDWACAGGNGREELRRLLARLCAVRAHRGDARSAGELFPPHRGDSITAPMEQPIHREERVTPQRVERARAACRAADRALADGSLALAERLYEGALAHAPAHAPALRGLGEVCARSGQPERARGLFDRYLAAAPDAADAHDIRDRLDHLGSC
jgi:serine/threonine protein kinase